ncbi:MAG: NUDIX domain-containing protein [Dermatophilaceae bacterium]
MAGVDNTPADPHFAHLAEGNARQARKRVAADALIRDNTGRVLTVDPTYKEGWDLPGGMIEANEAPRAGLARELAEELGITRDLGRPLVVEWVGAHGPWDDQIVVVFDGGVMTDTDIAAIRISDPEIATWQFTNVDDARAMMREHLGRRLSRAVRALDDEQLDYCERDTGPAGADLGSSTAARPDRDRRRGP